MNILWIEDFGAGLDSGKNTLNSLFGDLLSFDQWDNDEQDIVETPSDLQVFCQQQKSQDTVYLCRNYFDYAAFKQNHDLISKIDAVMIDVRLDNGEHVDLEDAIPEPYTDKRKFHENGGFYIFNDLVHLGIASEKMCFMTAEISSVTGFEKKCTEIYIPKVTTFEKGDVGFKALRNWLTDQKSDYVTLRRGIIEGCEFLKQYLAEDEQNIQFREFIKNPAYEIATIEIVNYLDTLSQFLPLKEESDSKRLNMHYRLFLRTLAHAWEENFDANSFKKRQGDSLANIHDIYTFAWIMKMIRNWVSHANLLEPLDTQFIAFSFLANMRAMFTIPLEVQDYEVLLLQCLNSQASENLDSATLQDEMKYAVNDLDGLLRIDDKRLFSDKMNCLYRENTGNPDAEAHDFKKLLYQYFWVNQKNYKDKLVSKSTKFLPTLACHLYKPSFQE